MATVTQLKRWMARINKAGIITHEATQGDMDTDANIDVQDGYSIQIDEGNPDHPVFIIWRQFGLYDLQMDYITESFDAVIKYLQVHIKEGQTQQVR